MSGVGSAALPARHRRSQQAHRLFSLSDFGFLPGRLFGILTNQTLIAVPLFVFMGAVLVGALMAASTGIIGATVVTLGLMALPNLLKQGYHPALATGTICAIGTLGQIVPPSIALVLLAGLNWALASPKRDILMSEYDYF